MKSMENIKTASKTRGIKLPVIYIVFTSLNMIYQWDLIKKVIMKMRGYGSLIVAKIVYLTG